MNQNTSIHEPYELTLIDLKELTAIVKKDHNECFYADIQNPKYKLNIISPHQSSLETLRILLKLKLFYYKLHHKEIRYCKTCDHNLIIDPRRFVDVCSECYNG
jgi:hypothetical protein